MKKMLQNLLLMTLLLSAGWSYGQSTVLKSEPKPTKGEVKPAKGTKTPDTFPVAADPATKAAEAAVAVDSLPPTKIAFEHDTYDFGKIKQGDVVKHDFVFTNTGDKPLVLENVKPTCGCTAIDWPRDPVPPGGQGKIKAQFNTAGKMGAQMKYITIVYNGEPKITRVTFTGEVVPADGAAPAPADH